LLCQLNSNITGNFRGWCGSKLTDPSRSTKGRSCEASLVINDGNSKNNNNNPFSD